uniref:Uncharacterized protein n=1 Tax=Arundo donax TaxID=35708 RepID=A0A0A9AF08_ARUDO
MPIVIVTFLVVFSTNVVQTNSIVINLVTLL